MLDLLRTEYTDEPQHINAEERKRQAIAQRMATARWWEAAAAALYDMGGEAKVPQLAEHPFIEAIAQAKGRTTGIKQTLWGMLQRHTITDSETVNITLRLAPAIFDKGENSVWGLPANGRKSARTWQSGWTRSTKAKPAAPSASAIAS